MIMRADVKPQMTQTEYYRWNLGTLELLLQSTDTSFLPAILSELYQLEYFIIPTSVAYFL